MGAASKAAKVPPLFQRRRRKQNPLFPWLSALAPCESGILKAGAGSSERGERHGRARPSEDCLGQALWRRGLIVASLLSVCRWCLVWHFPPTLPGQSKKTTTTKKMKEDEDENEEAEKKSLHGRIIPFMDSCRP
uniref:Uncharacterized protein n=1 Tax=Physcomitrium patens TaxID=3218 RepID=A0A7I3ZQX0_PHYPA